MDWRKKEGGGCDAGAFEKVSPYGVIEHRLSLIEWVYCHLSWAESVTALYDAAMNGDDPIRTIVGRGGSV
ncbi:hypothetical protein ET1_03_00490 [Edwardsiella tarda ATCC 15947 = NBRC 105688]|nr:hypothetical protein ET1_03_00490 [Edwardsiella tarda ATCC 15947 = NBRC 105688]